MRIDRLVAGALVALAGAAAGSGGALAGDDLIGALGHHRIAEGDTLVDLAVRTGLGYVELVAANPGVDPWVPAPGTTIVLPTAHLLPDAPRRGIVINLPEMRLYFFPPAGGAVTTVPLGIGKSGRETPLGHTEVVAKREHPVWVPPPSIRAERPGLPEAVPPGPDNPLGAFALDLGWPNYVIHGTNKPYGIGRRVSHGCIRLYPGDIAALFDEVAVGTPVTVVDQPVKLGWSGADLYLEVHTTQAQADRLEAEGRFLPQPIPRLEARVAAAAGSEADRIDWEAVRAAAEARRGVPVRVTRPVSLDVAQ